MDHLPPRYRYSWPQSELASNGAWALEADSGYLRRTMPELAQELAIDSRWPAFFPSPISLVTTGSGDELALEKVVGASIVNRFPYVMALSFCREPLSERHYPRSDFTRILERTGVAAVQFIDPGNSLDAAMESITRVPDSRTTERIRTSGLSTRPARTCATEVLDDAYMVYELSLVQPKRDFDGAWIYQQPWIDVGSHRVYFLEVRAIQLREDIASGATQIEWRSLPAWQSDHASTVRTSSQAVAAARYQKGYTPHYKFPSSGTIAFAADEYMDGMAIKHLPPLPDDQVEVDNDMARWPCFFPSSLGIITTFTEDGRANIMPCGSTTVLSRQPLTIAPCVSYARINERYAPRATLPMIRRSRRFGCGVPFISDAIVDAIKCAGNVSFAEVPDKVRHAGLSMKLDECTPIVSELPVHFHCEVIEEVRLGTHVMFIGEVREILVRSDLSPERPIEWYPWARLRPAAA